MKKKFNYPTIIQKSAPKVGWKMNGNLLFVLGLSCKVELDISYGNDIITYYFKKLECMIGNWYAPKLYSI